MVGRVGCSRMECKSDVDKSRCSVRCFEQSARVRASPWAARVHCQPLPPANYFPAQLAANCALALAQMCSYCKLVFDKMCRHAIFVKWCHSTCKMFRRYSLAYKLIQMPNLYRKICIHSIICNLPEKLSEIALNTFANFAVREYVVVFYSRAFAQSRR